MRMKHQSLEDGRVLVSIIGGSPMHARVPASEAKRFAWALLADLDPDGVMEAGEAIEPLPRNLPIEREPMAAGEQMRLICDYLASRDDASTRDVAGLIGTNTQHAAVQLNRMAKKGMVAMVVRGRAHAPSIWRAGEMSFEQWRRRFIPQASAA